MISARVDRLFVHKFGVLALTVLLLTTSAVTGFAQGGGVSDKMLLDAQSRSDGWLHYGRNYAAWRHIPVDTINRKNVTRLVPKWIYQTGIGGGGFEVSAVTHNNKMYITTPNSHLICIDARDGSPIWRYDHIMPPNVNLCCGPVNRGVAISGNRIYYVTLDAHLLCFDADTGLQLWDRTVADYRDSHSLTLAPLIIKDKVLVGIAGGEYGIRGFIDAYFAESGERAWRFYTIPGEGEEGNDSWAGDSWKTGGAPAWVTGTYDPELNLVYWGIGNPGPDFNGDVRMGDNLYSDSIVALNADTGKLAWYFQASPHDVFDWDGTSEPILVDETIRGKAVKALVQVNRNGYVYALDRTDGSFLYAKPYTKVTWANIDESGIPVLKPELSGPGFKYVCPGIFGGKNWPPSAYSPDTHMVYIPDMERCSTFVSLDVVFRRGLPFYGGGLTLQPPESSKGYIRAMDVRTGEMAWSFETPGGPNWAGLLSTGGGLVFGGAPDGKLRALNDETGEILWEYQTGSGIFAPPTSFTMNGKQYIGIASGWGQPAEGIGINTIDSGSAYLLFGLMDD